MRKDDETKWESERSKAFNIFSNQTKRKVNVNDEQNEIFNIKRWSYQSFNIEVYLNHYDVKVQKV